MRYEMFWRLKAYLGENPGRVEKVTENEVIKSQERKEDEDGSCGRNLLHCGNAGALHL